ncbi:hypothetical protein [Rhodococcus triatomae]|nr:hypothetical protein G419_17687 [Rhodococcus triatomae BKS 15-14]
MMILVRLIDAVVTLLRVLGGSRPAPTAVRALAWVAFASLVLFGLGVAVFVVAHLLDIVEAITGETYH